MNIQILTFTLLVILGLASCSTTNSATGSGGPYLSLPEGVVSIGELPADVDTATSFGDPEIAVRGTTELLKEVGTSFKGVVHLLFVGDNAGNITYVELDKENTKIKDNIDFYKFMQVFKSSYKLVPTPIGTPHRIGTYKFKLDINRTNISNRSNIRSVDRIYHPASQNNR